MATDSAPKVLSASEYWQVVGRRKLQFFVPFVVLFSVAVALALLLPPTYRSEATILVERQEIPENFIGTTVTGFVQERIESITQKVLTRQNLLELGEDVGIAQSYIAEGQEQAMVEMLKESIMVEMVDIEATDPGKGRATTLTVAFIVAAEASTSSLAQKIATHVTDLYLKENKRMRVEQATEVQAFLENQSNILAAQISGYEAKLAKFKQEQVGQLPGQIEMNQAMLDRAETRIESTEEAIRTLQNQKRGLEAELGTVDKYVSRDADPEKANSTLERLGIARQQLNEARQKYSDLHPTVKRLNSQISALEKEARLQNPRQSRGVVNGATNPGYIRIRSQLAAIRTDLAAENKKLVELEQKAAVLGERIMAAPLVERDYTSLIREYDSSKEAFAQIQAKKRHAQLASNLEEDDKGQKFRLLEEANAPSQPVAPNRIAIFILGLFVAGLAGIGVVLIAELSDKTIRGTKALARLMGAPPIGVIPLSSTVHSTAKV